MPQLQFIIYLRAPSDSASETLVTSYKDIGPSRTFCESVGAPLIFKITLSGHLLGGLLIGEFGASLTFLSVSSFSLLVAVCLFIAQKVT